MTHSLKKKSGLSCDNNFLVVPIHTIHNTSLQLEGWKSFVAIWLELGVIMLSERSQTQKDDYYKISCIYVVLLKMIWKFDGDEQGPFKNKEKTWETSINEC